MRIILPVAALSIFALNVLGAAAPVGADREAELRATVDEFGRAFVEADVPTLSLLLADNYVHVNGSSGNVIGRKDWLEWVESRHVELKSGELEITAYRVEDLKIVMHGNTAVVVGTVFSRQVTDSTASTVRVRFSNTWLYHESKWRRAAFHDSPIA